MLEAALRLAGALMQIFALLLVATLAAGLAAAFWLAGVIIRLAWAIFAGLTHIVKP